MAEWQRWRNIMKCVPFEEKRLAKWSPPYIVQPKLDGDRCRAVPLNTDADIHAEGTEHIPSSLNHLLLSSEENIFHSVPHINEEFSRLRITDEIDGELYCHGMTHEQIHGIVSRTVNIHPDYRQIQFHVFDIVNTEVQARRLLHIEELRGKSNIIVVVPYWICESLDDVTRAYDKLINLGYEGIIVRNINNFYEVKRSTLMMKFKPKQKDEYEIIGFKEEFSIEGTPKDTLGALVCKSGNGNTFNIGTGFTDERRKELWEARQILVGQIAVVKYQHITSGYKVPRFPVFVEIKVKV
jgi:ATP-dependent DNA ligase